MLKNFSEYDFNLTYDGLLFVVEQFGVKYHFLLDTGATSSVIWRERLKKHFEDKCLIVDPDIDNMNNDDCKATEMTLMSKQGQPIHFGTVIVPGNFKHMEKIDGMIGNNFIKKRVIILDFLNKKIFISNQQNDSH